jgi:class 3 adenylate cyclase
VPGTILIADDDKVGRKLLQRLLEAEGHSVRAAASGREALELFAAEPCDVVLLDILMPELDGIATLEQLKATPGAEYVPVVMISAIDDVESVVRCIEIGADDYLTKPFNPVLLRARITAGLTKKRLHDLERERVHDVFSRFLPEHVVDDVLERTDDDLRLGGIRTVGTVMFTDLRGFTSFTERRSPELVIAALNRYFDETSDAILEHGGTLVAYRGDGFLAVFGAPIEIEDHADRALATAREMVEVRLPRFNDWLHENGFGEEVAMGVGLHSGPFMSGNVGSLRRLEYTVHGDTVNTASRIEGMTKTLGGPILLSESTKAALVREPDDLEHLGEFEVRGRDSTVSLWTVNGAACFAAGIDDNVAKPIRPEELQEALRRARPPESSP